MTCDMCFLLMSFKHINIIIKRLVYYHMLEEIQTDCISISTVLFVLYNAVIEVYWFCSFVKILCPGFTFKWVWFSQFYFCFILALWIQSVVEQSFNINWKEFVCTKKLLGQILFIKQGKTHSSKISPPPQKKQTNKCPHSNVEQARDKLGQTWFSHLNLTNVWGLGLSRERILWQIWVPKLYLAFYINNTYYKFNMGGGTDELRVIKIPAEPRRSSVKLVSWGQLGQKSEITHF